MKRLAVLLFLLFAGNVVDAQYALKLVVTEVATKKNDDIYITGSFNEWKPGDAAYKLKPFGPGRKGIVLKNLPAGKYEFKFTRGNFNNVETNSRGEDINNRSIELNEDASLDIVIPGWKDDYPDKPKPNTATAQVKIIESSFEMPQLGRKTRIWTYLPKSYNQLKGKSYPVLYMHDGQNLFSEHTAGSGEWGVDEALDSLQRMTGKECIVVGIDHGGEKRMNEYNPYDDAKYGKGAGKEYVEFLVNTLKPFIDKNYRTIKDAKHTAVAGSSMGAIVSLYAEVKYPTVFGAAGMLSPALWNVPDMYPDVQSKDWKAVQRFYFYMGGKETETAVKDMERMIKLVKAKGNHDVMTSLLPTGQHNETYWRREFPQFYLWLVRNW